jgi:hypothetical protein
LNPATPPRSRHPRPGAVFDLGQVESSYQQTKVIDSGGPTPPSVTAESRSPICQRPGYWPSYRKGVQARDGALERIASEGRDRLRWGDVPVDLFFPQHRFHAVVASRTIVVPFRGRGIPVLAPTDLAIFKALFGRRKDWADIEAMLTAATVDEADAGEWLGRILGDDHPTRRKFADLAEEVRASSPDEPDGDPNVRAKRPSPPRHTHGPPC